MEERFSFFKFTDLREFAYTKCPAGIWKHRPNRNFTTICEDSGNTGSQARADATFRHGWVSVAHSDLSPVLPGHRRRIRPSRADPRARGHRRLSVRCRIPPRVSTRNGGKTLLEEARQRGSETYRNLGATRAKPALGALSLPLSRLPLCKEYFTSPPPPFETILSLGNQGASRAGATARRGRVGRRAGPRGWSWKPPALDQSPRTRSS